MFPGGLRFGVGSFRVSDGFLDVRNMGHSLMDLRCALETVSLGVLESDAQGDRGLGFRFGEGVWGVVALLELCQICEDMASTKLEV